MLKLIIFVFSFFSSLLSFAQTNPVIRLANDGKNTFQLAAKFSTTLQTVFWKDQTVAIADKGKLSYVDLSPNWTTIDFQDRSYFISTSLLDTISISETEIKLLYAQSYCTSWFQATERVCEAIEVRNVEVFDLVRASDGWKLNSIGHTLLKDISAFRWNQWGDDPDVLGYDPNLHTLLFMDANDRSLTVFDAITNRSIILSPHMESDYPYLDSTESHRAISVGNQLTKDFIFDVETRSFRVNTASSQVPSAKQTSDFETTIFKNSNSRLTTKAWYPPHTDSLLFLSTKINSSSVENGLISARYEPSTQAFQIIASETTGAAPEDLLPPTHENYSASRPQRYFDFVEVIENGSKLLLKEEKGGLWLYSIHYGFDKTTFTLDGKLSVPVSSYVLFSAEKHAVYLLHGENSQNDRSILDKYEIDKLQLLVSHHASDFGLLNFNELEITYPSFPGLGTVSPQFTVKSGDGKFDQVFDLF